MQSGSVGRNKRLGLPYRDSAEIDGIDYFLQESLLPVPYTVTLEMFLLTKLDV